MKNTLTKLAAAGALTLSATAVAMAGSVQQPGETVGVGAGAPLPPGFYFVDTSDWGVRDTASSKTAVGGTIPVIVWATPWKVLNARLSFSVATPAVEVGTTGSNPGGAGGTYAESLYNPYIGGTLAWDLGGGFGFSYGLGAFIGVKDPLSHPDSFLSNRFALSYTANGWDLTANATLGTALEGGVAGFPGAATNPDYVNLDLTATKAFGKWEVGAVGFYSSDLKDELLATGALGKQSQFALGALAGYDWGVVKTQVYLTRDVYEQNYGGFDTRVWGRIIVPLGDPFASASPSGLLYHK
jgi:hypothetical protein